jgi:hypothetical protein
VRSFLKVPHLFDSCHNRDFVLAIRAERVLVECDFRERDKWSSLAFAIRPAGSPEVAHRQCPPSKNRLMRSISMRLLQRRAVTQRTASIEVPVAIAKGDGGGVSAVAASVN